MYIGQVLQEAPLDMRHFNPNHVAEVAAACRPQMQTPRQRQILDNFIEHASTRAPRPTATMMR